MQLGLQGTLFSRFGMEQRGNPFALGQVDETSSASSGSNSFDGQKGVDPIIIEQGIQMPAAQSPSLYPPNLYPGSAGLGFPQEMSTYPMQSMQSGFVQQPGYLQQSFPQRWGTA
jgi:hypothetical protein